VKNSVLMEDNLQQDGIKFYKLSTPNRRKNYIANCGKIIRQHEHDFFDAITPNGAKIILQ
jgi:NAD-dependent dihydropyrimidine dehydrogenase PreA subunit